MGFSLINQPLGYPHGHGNPISWIAHQDHTCGVIRPIFRLPSHTIESPSSNSWNRLSHEVGIHVQQGARADQQPPQSHLEVAVGTGKPNVKVRDSWILYSYVMLWGLNHDESTCWYLDSSICFFSAWKPDQKWGTDILRVTSLQALACTFHEASQWVFCFGFSSWIQLIPPNLKIFNSPIL